MTDCSIIKRLAGCVAPIKLCIFSFKRFLLFLDVKIQKHTRKPDTMHVLQALFTCGSTYLRVAQHLRPTVGARNPPCDRQFGPFQKN